MGVKITGLNEAITAIEDAPYQAAKGLMLDIDRRLVQITPRDSGRLANNWVPSFNKPLDVSFPFDDDSKRPSSLSPEIVFPQRKPRNEFNHVLHLTNNVIYAEIRNEKGGKGGQPSPRWFERAISSAVKFALRR